MELLIAGGYLSTKSTVYGVDWVLDVPRDTQATLTLSPLPTLEARVIAANIPLAQITATGISVLINRPGDEAIHSLFYARDGSKTLTGDMYVDSQDIDDAGQVFYAD